MLVSNPASDNMVKPNDSSFAGAMGQSSKSKGPVGMPMAVTDNSGSYSGGGLVAADGDTRDPFPPSLVAYIEVLRSVAEYLRSQGMISRPDREFVAEKVAAPKEIQDVEEPTTFAIGEEDHDCAAPGATPAIGEAVTG